MAMPPEIEPEDRPRDHIDAMEPPPGGPPTSPVEHRHTSLPVLTRAQRVRWWLLASLWAAVTVTFWWWWASHAAAGPSYLYWLETVALGYQTCVLPTLFWYYVRRMRAPVEAMPQHDLRVAMISLCVPAEETLAVIEAQLRSLAAVEYPHDSWVLDEGGSDAVRQLARRHGVRYFTRKGVSRWNEPGPPFQRATKAGNVNAWLEAAGLEYDVFVQLDIDHHPRRDYLERVLGYFRDPQVAWVQAPSVSGNLDRWTARGLAEQDLVFQGPLQMGFYGATRTPFIIGSHTTYRTSAVCEIGGFQPTRAEDHLDTVVLAAAGYEGVYVPELIAVGNGPHDLTTYLRQQFAWAYSMFQIFLRHTPRLLRRYTPARAVQFLMAQSWYPLWSLTLGLLWVLPTVALLTGMPIAHVRLSHFFLFFIPVLLTSSLMWCECRRWFQPANVRLSWRSLVLEVARWPVVLWALINVLCGIRRSYMITPKGADGSQPPARTAVHLPYLCLAALPLAGIWIYRLGDSDASGGAYYALVLANAFTGLLVSVTLIVLDLRQSYLSGARLATLKSGAAPVVCAGALCFGLALTVSEVWSPMLQAIQ